MKTYTVQDFGPNDLLTSEKVGVRRVAVDPQQTSYEDNTQFRFYDRISNVLKSSQIVYKFTTTYPLNITARVIELVAGGREYSVYPSIGNETFTGVLTDLSSQVFPVSQILREGLSSHPDSGVQIGRAIGDSIFSTTDAPRNGTIVLAQSGGNNRSSTYSQSGERAGVGAGVSFYLVFDDITEVANNVDTHGIFRLQWEERF